MKGEGGECAFYATLGLITNPKEILKSWEAHRTGVFVVFGGPRKSSWTSRQRLAVRRGIRYVREARRIRRPVGFRTPARPACAPHEIPKPNRSDRLRGLASIVPNSTISYEFRTLFPVSSQRSFLHLFSASMILSHLIEVNESKENGTSAGLYRPP